MPANELYGPTFSEGESFCLLGKPSRRIPGNRSPRMAPSVVTPESTPKLAAPPEFVSVWSNLLNADWRKNPNRCSQLKCGLMLIELSIAATCDPLSWVTGNPPV